MRPALQRITIVSGLLIAGVFSPATSGAQCPVYSGQWGTPGSGDSEFNLPFGIATDTAGNVYVSDQSNNRIQKFTVAGTYLGQWGSLGGGNGEFYLPRGIALDPTGDTIYVADAGNDRIEKFTSSRTYLAQWGSSGSANGQFNTPEDVAIDSSGDVYVVDAHNHRIQKFTGAGTYLTQWGTLGSADGQFDVPLGITIDSAGHVYVTDWNNHRVQKFTSTGTYLTQWGSFGTGDGQFDRPEELDTNADNVYVIDQYERRIQKFTATGTYLCQWGSPGSGDGQFNSSTGLAIDATANIYIADTANNRIQKFGFLAATFTDINAGLHGLYNSAFGGGSAWGDYDNDGDLDILIIGTDELDNHTILYRNDGASFTELITGLPGLDFGFASWGDYDNDGDLDLLLNGQTFVGLPIFQIYRNEGGGVFTDINAGLPQRFGPVAWGDYDNDGDLDFLFTGGNSTISGIYHNDGSGGFTRIDIGVPANGYSVAWGDYDNDGDLDILLSAGGGPPKTRVYRNDGNGLFVDIVAGLVGVYGCAAWGDYDTDGDLDILLVGVASGGYVSSVYRNDGGVFVDIGAGLPGIGDGNAAWGDYDNDGDLDIVLAGDLGSGSFISRVYRNDGAATFTDINAGLENGWYGTVAWGDYDNDGDLDILAIGGTNGPPYFASRVYANNGVLGNTAPSTPRGLWETVAGNQVTFSWNAATDDHTPAAGLSYNLRVGTTPGGTEITSAMADLTNGYRRVVARGNAQQRLSWTLTAPGPSYYWSVQAIDSGFKGSPFGTRTGGVAAVNDGQTPPKEFALQRNTPNPFQSSTRIAFELPAAGHVELRIFDVSGRLVKTLQDGEMASGNQVIIWDGTDGGGQAMPAGRYFYRLSAGAFEKTRGMILLR